MSDEEMQVILDKADECMGEECPLDELDSLLTMLKDTQETLEGRLDKVSLMIVELNRLNRKEERETDEVKAFVKDMLRVFSHEKPNYTPVGFPGDIGDGPKTAFDVFPPKKWHPSA